MMKKKKMSLKERRKEEASLEPPPPPPEEPPNPEDAGGPVVEEEEFAIERTPVLEEVPPESWTSPYCEPPATLLFGPEKITYFVPQHFLPSQWTGVGTPKHFYFPDVDSRTGHFLVQYLYKEVYGTSGYEVLFNDQARVKLMEAVLVFIAASDHDLAGLQHLATNRIRSASRYLSLAEVLVIIDKDFSRLSPDSWIHKHVCRMAKSEFELDHKVFTDENFLEDVHDAALVKVMMRYIISLYNTLDTEELSCEEQESQNSRSDDTVFATTGIVAAEDVPVEVPCESEVEDAPPSDDFSTISCPVYEAPVVVWSDSEPPGPEPEPYVDECVPDSPVPEPVEEAMEIGPDAAPVPELEPETYAIDYVDETAEVVPCDPVMEEPVAGEELAMPDVTAPPVCEPADEIVEDNMALEPRCPRQSRHVLKGNGWKTCKRCRVVVAKLAREV